MLPYTRNLPDAGAINVSDLRIVAPERDITMHEPEGERGADFVGSQLEYTEVRIMTLCNERVFSSSLACLRERERV